MSNQDERQRATAFAERLCLCISRYSIDIPEVMMPITISLGVASNSKGRKCEANTLVQAADLALYWAKKNGRNRAEAATDEEIGKDNADSLIGE